MFQVTTPTNKETPTIDIEEIPVGDAIPDGVEECDVSLSEEPNDDKSPGVQRRKADHKRKLDERSSLVETELSSKKHDNRASEELHVPPPPPKIPLPEPMECLDDQVYERPRERRIKEDKRESVDMEKTPKVRRKHKSSGDLMVSPEPVSDNHQVQERKPPVTPKPVKRPVNKPEGEHFSRPSEPFERPEPQPSPRPPRQTPPPVDNYQEEKSFETSRPSLHIVETVDDPPPLPEKKRKPAGADKVLQLPDKLSSDLPKNNDADVRDTTVSLNAPKTDPVERIDQKEAKIEKIQSEIVPSCDLVSEPSKQNSTVISDMESHTENIVQIEKASDVSLLNVTKPPVSPISNELGIETCVAEESVSGKSSNLTEPEPRRPQLSGFPDPGPLPTADSTDKHISDNHLTIDHKESAIKLKNATEKEIKPDKKEPLVKPHPTKQLEADESYKPVPPPWVKVDTPKIDSFQNLVSSPKVQRAENSTEGLHNRTEIVIKSDSQDLTKTTCSPDQESIISDSKALHTVVCSPKITRTIKLSEPMDVSASPKLNRSENITESVSTDINKSSEKFTETPKSPKAESDSKRPSINNLPKLVIKPISNNNNEPREKQETQKPSINNLPRLKTPTPSGDSLTDPNNDGVMSPRIDPPLVKPFPGKTSEVLQPAKLMKQDSPKSLINNIPKPFKAEAEKPVSVSSNGPVVPAPQKVELKEAPTLELPKPNVTLQTQLSSKSTDSVGSCISLSSDEGSKSQQTTPVILPKPNGPNINYSTLSPSSSNSNVNGSSKRGPEKRDSKVIKAAAYWNNYIGEVTSKAKPPSNPKTMDKPKKIISAGIGERGLKELTSAFEQGKPIQQQEDKYTLTRRNSKKLNVESCNPGLRVNDAKSVFEKKFQQSETPRVSRRASSSLEKPRFNQTRDENMKTNPDSENSDGTLSPSKSDSPLKQSNVEEAEISTAKSKSPPPKAETHLTRKITSNETTPSTENKIKPPMAANIMEIKTISTTETLPLSTVESKLLSKEETKMISSEQSVDKSRTVNNAGPSNITSKEENMSRKPDEKFHSDSLKPTISAVKNEKKVETENCLKPVSQTSSSSQPKPPTSPKPNLRKEDLKTKETNAKEQTKLKDEAVTLVPPLVTKDKDVTEKAVIVKLKENELKNKVNPQKDIEVKKNDTTPVEYPHQKAIKTTKAGDVTKLIFANKTDGDKINGIDHLDKDSEGPKLVKTLKIKSPEPEKPERIASPEPNLSEIRSSLKKVPHAPVIRRKSSPENDSSRLEVVQAPSEKKAVIKEYKSEVTIPINSESNGTQAPKRETDQINSSIDSNKKVTDDSNTFSSSHSTKERIIPITFVNEVAGPKPFRLEVEESKLDRPPSSQGPERNEHYIPIVVEGSTRYSSRPENHDEDAERLDNFNASTLSRRRWGSRKKRMSSAFSDSSVSDDDALTNAFSGLQKYTSYGKHGLGEQPLFRLKKTRPPFSADKTESFSSGEDDFDDDGFQEMTAENLFSTLLSRVKSLTRRIHDEHDEHINWQRTRHGPPKLNPGGTHARLERTAQRNSIKRTGDYSRQSSGYDDSASPRSYHDSASQRSYNDTPSQRLYNDSPSQRSYNEDASQLSYNDTGLPRSYNDSPSQRSFNSSYAPTRIYNRSNSNQDSDSRYSTGSQFSTGSNKRYDESDTASDFSSSVSVTSSQRLRPGYLPPPANHNTVNASNINNPSSNSTDLDAQYFAQNLTTKANEVYERNIPISVHKNYNSESPGQSKPGTPLPTPGVYMKHMKPFSLNSTDTNDRLESQDLSVDAGDRQRRVSRFLRPDFYDIPKEDSIYAKMKELEDEDKKKPRFLRVVHSRARDSNSGRTTPLDSTSYSEDRSRSDTKTPVYDYGESSTPTSEGQLLNRALSLTRQNSLNESSRRLSVLNNVVSDSPSNPQPSLQTSCLVHAPETAPLVQTPQKYRRPIYIYGGAKSDGQLLNKHAHVTLNIIAAAERKKRQSFFPQEVPDSSSDKVNP